VVAEEESGVFYAEKSSVRSMPPAVFLCMAEKPRFAFAFAEVRK